MDKRLVPTLVQVCGVIIRFRNQKQAFLLSELGSSMNGYQGLSTSAPAATKSIGNLLRSLKWSLLHIDAYLIEEADKEVKRLKEQEKRILCPGDDSVLEKPESRVSEGVCPVTSSKAKRLHRNQKGLVFNFPPKKPSMVAGMQWTAALLTGLEGRVSVALMSWWTTKGDYAIKLREQQEALLSRCVRKWGDLLLHLFDRGYAGGPWLQVLQSLKVRFVLRWKKGHVFVNAQGVEKKLWQIGQGKKYLPQKEIRDTPTGKCELGMESPRLWSFENRLKLLGIVTLVYAFLLHLLNPDYHHLIVVILQLKCHRTGKRCRNAIAPLYRLRWAISRLWDDYHPALGALFSPTVQTLRVLSLKRG